MIGQGKMSAFMNQDPKQVAAFVWECMQYRQYEATDLIPYSAPAELEELGLDPHYGIDTFSSDYDEFIDDMGEC